MREITNYIGGGFAPAAGGGWLEVFEPATGRVHARCADSGAEDVRRAVDAGERAFAGWNGTSAHERGRVLERWAGLIERDAEELARAESADTGKPVELARRVDIPRAAANLRFFATAAGQMASECHVFDGGGVPGGAGGSGGSALGYTLRRARGVAGCISPWNLPLYLLTWKIAPALATGNTVVAKPSEVTPVTAWMLSGLAAEAGVPAGVFNVVHGRGDRAGAALVCEERVRAVSFTGSTRVGKWIGAKAGEMLKRVSLELGGKNAMVVFADAELDGPEGAIETAVRAGFTNQGQVCLCASRLMVEASAYERVVRGVVDKVRSLRVGDPLDAGTQQGALTSKEHLEKVERLVERARELGGRVLCGGKRVEAGALPERCREGWFYEPTVIEGLDPGCEVEREEIFGPVVSVRAFREEKEAIERANATAYGLAAVVFTRDVSRAHRLSAALDAGIVWVNCWMVRDLRTPFGGMKDSGVGREGGAEALRFFTEAVSVCVRVGGEASGK